jgi:DnaJ-class molecular chaperone
MRDYYEILEVPKSATADDIKKAYRKKASILHPDKGGDTAKFQEIQEAYATLSDPQKREAYNQYGHNAPQHNGGPQWTHNAQHVDPDMFKEMFGNMFGGAGSPFGDIFGNVHQQQAKPRHIINMSLEDAYKGKQLRLPGGISINVPAGVRTGTRFHSEQAVYEIQVPPHPKFKRAGDDLLVDVDINAIEAMLSVEALLDHLDSSQLQFTIPAGIQNQQVVRLAGKGMKNPETDRYGDLMVRITVTIPKSLTDEQIAFLKTMQRRESFNI